MGRKHVYEIGALQIVIAEGIAFEPLVPSGEGETGKVFIRDGQSGYFRRLVLR